MANLQISDPQPGITDNQAIRDFQPEIMVQRQVAVTIDRPTIQLIYRGEVYDYTRSPRKIDTTDRSNWQVVNLICKGHTYERKLPPPQPYRKPLILNWRWNFN